MKVRQFLVYPYPQEVGLAPSWAAGVVRDEKNERMVPTEAVACMLAAQCRNGNPSLTLLFVLFCRKLPQPWTPILLD